MPLHIYEIEILGRDRRLSLKTRYFLILNFIKYLKKTFLSHLTAPNIETDFLRRKQGPFSRDFLLRSRNLLIAKIYHFAISPIIFGPAFRNHRSHKVFRVRLRLSPPDKKYFTSSFI